MNKEECLKLYEEKIQTTTPAIAIDLVCKALVDDANKTYVDRNLRITAKRAYTQANAVFVAFSKELLAKHGVMVSKHHFMGYLKSRAPLMFSFLRTINVTATKEYDTWAKGGTMK